MHEGFFVVSRAFQHIGQHAMHFRPVTANSQGLPQVLFCIVERVECEVHFAAGGQDFRVFVEELEIGLHVLESFRGP